MPADLGSGFQAPSGDVGEGYVVKDATGNRFTFTANHYLEPGDYVKLRGGHGTDSDTSNVVYRDNCNFLWNNDRDTIYLYKPSAAALTSTPTPRTDPTPTATSATTTEPPSSSSRSPQDAYVTGSSPLCAAGSPLARLCR